ncbi:hypothetical protein LguiA_031318 [Lonicera macranthoides]
MIRINDWSRKMGTMFCVHKFAKSENNVLTQGDGVTLHGCDLDYEDYNVIGSSDLEAILLL